MPKDYPEFKSWKNLEIPCKKHGSKHYITDLLSGKMCAYCHKGLSLKAWKSSSRIIFFSGQTEKRRVCRRCYDKENKRIFTFLVIYFAFILMFFVAVFLKNKS